ncbi:MAG: TIM barrel protein [Chloroflexota bacterium]|nr:TIM barrel protein [Chloroflexota bacterium]
MSLKLSSAPVSWGITEIKGLTAALPYQKIMDEIAQAGYKGTELGPWGFYPTSPELLGRELAARDLQLVASFVDVPLHEPALFDEGTQAVKRAIPLLAELGAQGIILSAQGTPDRSLVAGWAGDADGLTARQWKDAGAYLRELALLASDAGLTPTFHHHAGTYVETPAEIERLFNEVDPALLGLCLDTGHLVYGGGDNIRTISTYGRVIRHVHLKNIDAEVLARVRVERLDYVQAVRAGVFSPLEAGSVDIPAVLDALKQVGYNGWYVVEQDIDRVQTGHSDPLQGATRAREYLQNIEPQARQ